MISLRGTVRRVQPKGNSPNGSPRTSPVPFQPKHGAEQNTEGEYNPKLTQAGEWIWSGHWSFGQLPDFKIDPKKKKALPAGVRPFLYKFSTVVDAKDVVVPSSLLESSPESGEENENTKQEKSNPSEDKTDETETEKKKITEKSTSEGNGEQNDALKKEKEENMSGTTEKSTSEDGEKNDALKKEKEENMSGTTGKPTSEDDGEKNDALKKEKEENSSGGSDTGSRKKDTDHGKEKDAADNNSDSNGDFHSKEVFGEKHNFEPNETITTNLEKQGQPASNQNIEDKKNQLPISKTSDEGTCSTTKGTEKEHTSKPQAKDNSREVEEENAAKDPKEDVTLSNKEVERDATFADQPYTDAGLTTHVKKCPIGGSWKGYFENTSKRKDRNSSRISEIFYLFFNSTPQSDALMAFADGDDGNGIDVTTKEDNKNKSALPPGYIHVRGSGSNQYGTFELLGGYNVESSVLSCQRIYIATNEVIETPSTRREKEKGKPKGSPTEKRPYEIRKRPMPSWKKVGYGNESGIVEKVGRRSGSGTKKRARTASEILSHSAIGRESKGSRLVPGLPHSRIVPDTLMPSGELKTSSRDNSNFVLSPARRPSIVKGVSSAARKSKPSSFVSNARLPSQQTGHQITLPAAGNVIDARWRAAHFMYYHRNTESQLTDTSGQPPQSANSSAPTSTSIVTSNVVYEGDMSMGMNMRDGMGVCLYNNKTIYEGEWKKNKEHGRGILMTGNRRRIIYVGDWERGKMHGKGTYYYHMYEDEKNVEASQNGGVYRGEFKENSRHGIGTYLLPDGSTYEGDWRENEPSGKGIFRWVDGSMYDGLWRDGKRNGFGKLISADGFQYEGNWVDNAMEGRGTAIYPSGQQYDGMWSCGKREGRGTIIFSNGAVYKGRFRDDCMEGQGTLKMERNAAVLRPKPEVTTTTSEVTAISSLNIGDDWMIPIEFQSDIGHIHQKAGFTVEGA